MSADIVWQDPPPKKVSRRSKGTGEWFEIAFTLRTRPGVWARIRSGVAVDTDVPFINTSRLVAFRPSGSFEATARRRNGAFDIYARYVGS